MISNKYLPALVCGFGAAVLSTIPGLKTIGCCVVVPAAAWLSLFLDQRINKAVPPITTKHAIILGIATGFAAALFSTFFDVLITLVTHTNDFVQTLPQTEIAMRSFNLGKLLDDTLLLLHEMSKDIAKSGFSVLYTTAILFSNIIVDIIFGLIGGLLGMVIQNKRT